MTRYVVRWLAAAAAGWLAALVAANPCAACSCADATGYDAYASASAVFRGTVLRVEQPGWWDAVVFQLWVVGAPFADPDPPEPRAILRVSEVWTGEPGPEVAVETGGGCEVSLTPGREYVVYAFRDEAGDLGANRCAPTVGEDQPARFLGERASLGPGTPVASQGG